MVELLAPAGDILCFEAALLAGADAVYVGGDKFGARAYAKNFSKDELLYAIDKAHLFGKKLYLTINTLIKDEELLELVPYLLPYYEAGLDGVIVQDLGALKVMTEHFPGLEMHASTQMTITGIHGASLLKDYGVTRVVPARELSLAEMVQIKQQTGLEIEAFIHGAMCYAYSGQCLFSSMLGSRSGNRGRCAGPCRLPYQTCLDGRPLNSKNEMYQLSLKDLCTLEILPQLIDAGIDSFKIEGRMKTPQYVSFVTAMYRKYIDLYYANGSSYKVSGADMESLQGNFSRGSIQSGYYNQHNGRNLVTLQKPGYQSFTNDNADAGNETNLQNEQEPIMNMADASRLENLKISTYAYFEAKPMQPMALTLIANEKSIQVFGQEPQIAQNRPVSISDIEKQLAKTGNTAFHFETIDISMEGSLFIPNKALNELRRMAIEELMKALLANQRRQYKEKTTAKHLEANSQTQKTNACMQLRVQTLAQLKAAGEYLTGKENRFGRIYLSFDCLEEINALSAKQLESFRQTLWTSLKKGETELVLTLPAVLRQKAVKLLDQHSQIIASLDFDGFCVGNLEGLSYIRQKYPRKKCIGDGRLYIWNQQTMNFLVQYGLQESICSWELHKSELKALSKAGRKQGYSFVLPVYGYIPVMESAGCVLKTNKQCQMSAPGEKSGQKTARVSLIDRQHKELNVITHCSRCENTIYNAVPLSLHKEAEDIAQIFLSGILLDFTRETTDAMIERLSYYSELFEAVWQKKDARTKDIIQRFPLAEFTKGHFLKGVE